jgi:hypothetical protein
MYFGGQKGPLCFSGVPWGHCTTLESLRSLTQGHSLKVTRGHSRYYGTLKSLRHFEITQTHFTTLGLWNHSKSYQSLRRLAVTRSHTGASGSLRATPELWRHSKSIQYLGVTWDHSGALKPLRANQSILKC